jgi:hypothetical protein
MGEQQPDAQAVAEAATETGARMVQGPASDPFAVHAAFEERERAERDELVRYQENTPLVDRPEPREPSVPFMPLPPLEPEEEEDDARKPKFLYPGDTFGEVRAGKLLAAGCRNPIAPHVSLYRLRALCAGLLLH